MTFGKSRVHTINDTVPPQRELLNCENQIEFDDCVVKYWENSCVVYGGEVTKFGLVFDDEEIIIRNAKGQYDDIPENYKKPGTVIKGNINFGEDYSPAMIKTENTKLKNIDLDEVEKIRKEKAQKRGAFEKRIYLKEVKQKGE